MPWHFSVVVAASLESPSADVESPSKFVQRAEKLQDVELAVRTAGRYDVVVWIHPDHDGGSAGDPLSSAMETALEVQGLEGVRNSSLMVWRPDDDHQETS